MSNTCNFVTAIAYTMWMSVACFAHTLKLCVHDAENTTPGFNDLRSEIRTIVGYCKRNSHARAKLYDIQKAWKNLKSFKMCLRAGAVNSSCCYVVWSFKPYLPCTLLPLMVTMCLMPQAGRRHLLICLSWSQSPKLQCQHALQHIPHCQKLSISCTVCILYLEKNWLWRQWKCHFWKELASVLKNKIPQLQGNSLHSSCCTWPEVQTYLFLNWNRKELHQDADMHICCWESFSDTLGSARLPAHQKNVEGMKKSVVCGTFEPLATQKNVNPLQPPVDDPLCQYLESPILPRQEGPLPWWGTTGKQKCTLLARAAHKHLSVPAAQDDSGQLFSACSSTVANCRDLLLGHVKQLAFLRGNMVWLPEFSHLEL